MLDVPRRPKALKAPHHSVVSLRLLVDSALRLAPGLVLTLSIAVAAFGLHKLPLLSAISPMMPAVLLGVTLHHTTKLPNWMDAGLEFSQRRLLRLAIILLGLQLTFTEVAQLGVIGLLILAATLGFTFVFTVRLARVLKVEARLAQLIAAGTAVCGASAVVAANAVVGGEEEDVTYAVACVTIYGTIAMFAYPVLPGLLHLNSSEFGFWAGASIHEIAQVVAASFGESQVAGEMGTVAKLSRVMMLAPLVIGLDFLARRDAGNRNISTRTLRASAIPWFVVGFIVAVGINSLVAISAELKSHLMILTTFLLTAALAAMGMHTDLARLRTRGFRPALVGALACLFVAVFSLTAIKLLI